MRLAATLALSPALAADLDVAVGFNEAEPKRIVVKDVENAVPPPLVVADDEGVPHLVRMAVNRRRNGSYTLTTTLTPLEEGPQGLLFLSADHITAPPLTLRPRQTTEHSWSSGRPYFDGSEVKFYLQNSKITTTVTE